MHNPLPLSYRRAPHPGSPLFFRLRPGPVSSDQFLSRYGVMTKIVLHRGFDSSPGPGRSIQKEPGSSGAGSASPPRLHRRGLGSGRAPLQGPVPITPAVRAPGRDVRTLCDNGGVWHRRRRPDGESPGGSDPKMRLRTFAATLPEPGTTPRGGAPGGRFQKTISFWASGSLDSGLKLGA